MGFKGITTNTPPEQDAHLLAEDDAAIYEGLIGTDRVLNIGNKLNASVITNNKVRISDGVVIVGGHAGRIIKGDYEDMTIQNGVSGQKRNDLIVARFMHGGDDTYKLVVVKGASGSTPSDPAVVKGNLYAGDAQRDYPLWRVRIEGLSIVKVEQLYQIGMSSKELQEEVAALNSNLYQSTNGKFVLPNGLKIFWGEGTTSLQADPAGIYSAEAIFQTQFKDSNYMFMVQRKVEASHTYRENNVFVYYTKSKASAWAGSQRGGQPFTWIAIGY